MVWDTSPCRFRATKSDTITNKENGVLPLGGLQFVFITAPVCGP